MAFKAHAPAGPFSVSQVDSWPRRETEIVRLPNEHEARDHARCCSGANTSNDYVVREHGVADASRVIATYHLGRELDPARGDLA